MGFFDKIGGAFFNSLQPDLSNLDAAQRLKVASKHLSGEKGAEAKANMKEAVRISQMSQFVNEKQRLDSPEARDLRLKDGTAWLNLVLMSYARDKSILVTVMDLPMQMKQVLAAEKQKRDSMPEAKQKILDAAVHDLEKKILDTTPKTPLAVHNNEPSALDKAA